MRIILIDPAKELVTEQNVVLTLAKLHELIDCHTIDSFRFSWSSIGYVDDNGLYRPPDENGCLPHTWFRDTAYPIAGKIVLTGWPTTAAGDTTACQLTIEEVRSAIVRFANAPLLPRTWTVQKGT